MSQGRPTKTDLRRGRVRRLRKPKQAMEAVTAQELALLDSDPADADETRPVTLHDSTDDPRQD